MFSWLPQKKKDKAAALRSRVVFVHEVCVSFGLNSEGNLPGAAHADWERSGCAQLPLLTLLNLSMEFSNLVHLSHFVGA